MRELKDSIEAAAATRIRSFERRINQAYVESQRRQRRSRKMVEPLAVSRPSTWSTRPEFDPYHVRAKSASIAHSITSKIQAGTYQPLPPIGIEIPKASGGIRIVASFPIADEVISRRVYDSVLRKNRASLSARSYAYRGDLNGHDAIAHLHAEWRNEHRVFVAQYDFSDYFGSLDHEYLRSTLDSLGLALTRSERRIIDAFLQAPAPGGPGGLGHAGVANTRGIHQGTSISLLMANVAATPLDREFERLGVSFARFADDIVVSSRDYAAVNRAIEAMYRFADQAGCTINSEKSPGVRLLVMPETRTPEMTSVSRIEFLSHSIGLRAVGFSDHALEVVKGTISQHIYDHLLREPRAGTQKRDRFAGRHDRDYVALIWHLRRYLYGSLSENQLRRLLDGPIPQSIRLSGAIARLPLTNDTEQLLALDRWIQTQVWLALRRRSALLVGKRKGTPRPWDMSRKQLPDFVTRSTRSSEVVDARMPSAVRMAELVKRAVRAHGVRVTTYSASLYGS